MRNTEKCSNFNEKCSIILGCSGTFPVIPAGDNDPWAHPGDESHLQGMRHRWQWRCWQKWIRWRHPERRHARLINLHRLCQLNASQRSCLLCNAHLCNKLLLSWLALVTWPGGWRLMCVFLPRLWPYSMVGGIGSCNLCNSIRHMRLCLLERSVGCWCSCVVRCFSDKCSQAYQDQTFVSNNCLNLFQKLLLEWVSSNLVMAHVPRYMSWRMYSSDPVIILQDCCCPAAASVAVLLVKIAETQELFFAFLIMLCLTNKLCLWSWGSVHVVVGIIIVIWCHLIIVIWCHLIQWMRRACRWAFDLSASTMHCMCWLVHCRSCDNKHIAQPAWCSKTSSQSSQAFLSL